MYSARSPCAPFLQLLRKEQRSHKALFFFFLHASIKKYAAAFPGCEEQSFEDIVSITPACASGRAARHDANEGETGEIES